MQKNHGFTLVELSIVLVIIGLLAGGILIGRDLILAAEIRKQVQQIRDYEVAVNTFKLKYNCFPGDCGTASNFWQDAIDGNGNGRIENNNGQTYDQSPNALWSISYEVTEFFSQMIKAGLLSPAQVQTGTVVEGLPSLVLNSRAGFFPNNSDSFTTLPNGRNPVMTDYKRGNNLLWFVACNFQGTPPDDMKFWDDRCGVLTQPEAEAMDRKIDDGSPLSGKFLGFGGAWTPNTTCLLGNAYDVRRNTRECQAAYELD
jgi:prepilin-type N-terminal cleavage/methylation domain-containing protein